MVNFLSVIINKAATELMANLPKRKYESLLKLKNPYLYIHSALTKYEYILYIADITSGKDEANEKRS